MTKRLSARKNPHRKPTRNYSRFKAFGFASAFKGSMASPFHCLRLRLGVQRHYVPFKGSMATPFNAYGFALAFKGSTMVQSIHVI